MAAEVSIAVVDEASNESDDDDDDDESMMMTGICWMLLIIQCHRMQTKAVMGD